LAFIMILDFSIMVHHAISDVFQITVNLRHGSWKSDIRGSESRMLPGTLTLRSPSA
jgi:hypothetical protein